MRITENRLRKIIREIILEYDLGDEWADHAAELEKRNAPEKKRKGIKLRRKKPEGETEQVKEPEKRRTGIKLHSDKTSLLNIERLIKNIDKSYNPDIVNVNENLWKHYNETLNDMEYTFNIGGGGNYNLKGLVVKRRKGRILFVPFNKIDSIFRISNKEIQYDKIADLVGREIGKTNEKAQWFKDKNNMPMNKVKKELEKLGYVYSEKASM